MDLTAARPLQAALTSAVTFSVGAILPLLAVLFLPTAHVAIAVTLVTLLGLAILGATGARLGGANIGLGVVRVTVWGAAAMGFTSVVGYLFGVGVA
jgi:VIT1/CCC1 family predicted Fe2+/Mn2+ transporter